MFVAYLLLFAEEKSDIKGLVYTIRYVKCLNSILVIITFLHILNGSYYFSTCPH